MIFLWLFKYKIINQDTPLKIVLQEKTALKTLSKEEAQRWARLRVVQVTNHLTTTNNNLESNSKQNKCLCKTVWASWREVLVYSWINKQLQGTVKDSLPIKVQHSHKLWLMRLSSRREKILLSLSNNILPEKTNYPPQHLSFTSL